MTSSSRRPRKTNGACSCFAFTLIEVLVVVAIITLLVGILIPSLKVARDRAVAVVCSSHLSQIGTAIGAYVVDSKDRLPGLYRIANPITTYIMARDRDNHNALETPKRLVTNLGYLSNKRFIPTPELFYCPSQSRDGYSFLGYDSIENPWSGQFDIPPEKVRSSYLARLIEVDYPPDYPKRGQGGLQPMKAGVENYDDGYGEWKIQDYWNKAIYSDFTGVHGYRNDTTVEFTEIWMPHNRRGFNRLFGDGSVLWGTEQTLIKSRLPSENQPSPEQMVLWWKELDRGR